MSRRFGDDDDDDDRPKKKAAKPVARRSALKTTGLAVGGVFGLAAAGIGARIYQTDALGSFTQGPGFNPMQLWQAQLSGAKNPDITGKPQGLIAAGLLAASAQNAQPWAFAVNNNTVDVMLDDKRTLGPLDPRGRASHIGIGCCIENMSLGASAVAVNPLLNMFPDGPDGKVIARFTAFDSADAITERAKTLGKRLTNRGPYAVARPIEAPILQALEALNTNSSIRMIWLRSETEFGKRFAAGTLKAAAETFADAETRAALEKWQRPTQGAHTDGMTLAASGMTPIDVRLGFALPKGITGDPFVKQLEHLRDVQLATAPLFGLMAIPNPTDRASLVEVGRLWQRLHVQITIMGLSAQPLNQLIAMAERDDALGRPSAAAENLSGLATLGTDRFVFAFRLGHSRAITTPSPRRSLNDVIAKA